MQIGTWSGKEQTGGGWNDAKITAEWSEPEKYGNEKGKERKGEHITGISSRPSYGDERWGAIGRSNKSLHYMVSQGTWGN